MADGTDIQKQVRKIGEWLARGSADAKRILTALYDLQKLSVPLEIVKATKITAIVEPFCEHENAEVARKAKQLHKAWTSTDIRRPSGVSASQSSQRNISEDVKPLLKPSHSNTKTKVDVKEPVKQFPDRKSNSHASVTFGDDVKPALVPKEADTKPKPARYREIDLFATAEAPKKKRRCETVTSDKQASDVKVKKLTASASAPDRPSTKSSLLPSGLFAKPLSPELKLTADDFADFADVDLNDDGSLSPLPTSSRSHAGTSIGKMSSHCRDPASGSSTSKRHKANQPSTSTESPQRRAAKVNIDENVDVFLRKKSTGAHLFLAGGSQQSTSNPGFVPSLAELCQRVLVRYADAIEYVGACPYSLISDAVKRLTPEQLARFDSFNPQLIEDTKACWKEHVQRTFRVDYDAGKARRRRGESWSETYWRLVADRDRRFDRITAAARTRIDKEHSLERSARVTNEIRLPREVARRAVFEPAVIPLRPGHSGGSNARPSSSSAPTSDRSVINNGSEKTHVGPVRVLPSRDFTMFNGSVAKKSVALRQAPLLRKTLKLAKACGELNAYRNPRY